VKLFGDVSLARVHPDSGSLDASEGEEVGCIDLVDDPSENVPECGVDTEGVSIQPPGERCLSAKSDALVNDAFAFDCILALWRDRDREGQEVSEVEATRALEGIEDFVPVAGDTKIHIASRACPTQAKLEGDAAFGYSGISHRGGDARQKAVEDQSLAKTVDRHARIERR
jgi:hypothetical protein